MRDEDKQSERLPTSEKDAPNKQFEEEKAGKSTLAAFFRDTGGYLYIFMLLRLKFYMS